MGLYQALRSNESYGKQISNYSWLRDEERGILLPAEYGFENGFDCAGRPQRVNLSTISKFYADPRNIMALDRLVLPEMNRLEPPTPHQRIFFKEASSREFLFFQMMRGGSKTTSCARWSIDYAAANPVPIIFTGPSFKQSLLMFDTVVKIITTEEKNENSPLRLQSELIGDPKRNSIDALVRFANGASIRALPMGDGSKIRGYRGGVLIIDEGYQITEEMYRVHLAPFAGVKMAGRESKIIITTTSWYQDCYMYRRLMEICSEIKRGNPAYGFLDFNLKDLVETGFPLSTNVWKDAKRHSDKTDFAMTYFNIWPKSSARWYTQASIDSCLDPRHAVVVEKKREEDSKVPYFAVIDLASSEKGDSTFATEYKVENGQAKAVWAHEERGLAPAERAWLVHEMDRKFDNMFVVYDSHGAIGQDLRKDLSEKQLLVKGKLHDVTPIVHHDAFNLSGKRKLIPVSPNDTLVRNALMGPRDGTSIRGEAGLLNLLHTNLRDMLNEEQIVGPAYGRDERSGDYENTDYAVVDSIRKAFNQLAGIGGAKDKQGNQIFTKDNQMVFVTRPGLHDDGAFTIIYVVIGLLAVLFRTVNPNTRTRPISAPIIAGGFQQAELDREVVHVQRLTIA
jgi:hypothetical protein